MLFDAVVVVGENLWASSLEKKTPKKYLGGVIQMMVGDCQF